MPASESETRVLVRLYGADEPLCDRKSEEALVHLLSTRGFGPKVLGLFPGGRVEMFWQHRRPLIPAESLKRAPVDFAGMVARRLAELHNLKLQVPGRATAEEQLGRWLAAVQPGGPIDVPTLSEAIAGASSLRPAASCPTERAVEEVLTTRTLCHLDLFAANLLYGTSDSTENDVARNQDVQFIDYEYASDAMVGLDIANHMSGCTELIEGESVTFDTSFYPSSAQQMHFLANYLAERGLSSLADTLSSDPSAAKFAKKLLVGFAAEAECRWVVWGLLQQQLSSVPFDFGDYALQRWACFETYKAWLASDEDSS
jgi:thiamine kinase-like enzyme